MKFWNLKELGLGAFENFKWYKVNVNAKAILWRCQYEYWDM